jgi:ribose 5-phosphate isomerase B
MEKILVAADHAGFALKEKLKKFLQKKGYAAEDLGTYTAQRCDYPKFSARLAGEISRKRAARGILICKSGIGTSIVANRFPGVRASLCYNVRAARLTREHNDSNVLVLGAGFVSGELAERIAAMWLATGFSGGRHARRLGQIKKIEKKLRGC